MLETNPREVIGGNQPPGMIDTANLTAADINEFLKENPVIETLEQANETKLMLDRGKLCQLDLDDERKLQVAPLNEQVKSINERYKPAFNLLESLVLELRKRGTRYLVAEKEKRERIAAEKARLAMEAEAAAREGERIEREAKDNAAKGELDVDVAAVSQQADSRFAAYKKADREAARADRETNVKLSGGFGRASGLRDKETLIVVDAVKAVQVIGESEHITEAIIKAARSFRKIHDQLPAGVISQTEKAV